MFGDTKESVDEVIGPRFFIVYTSVLGPYPVNDNQIVLTMKKTIFLFVAYVLTFGLASCGGKMVKQPDMTADEDSVATDSASSETEASTKDISDGWFYNKSVDDLTGNVTAINGYLVSKNAVEYDSGKTARLVITLIYGNFAGSVKNTVLISFGEDDYKLCRFADFQGMGLLAVFDDGEVDDSWRNLSMGSTSSSLVMNSNGHADNFIKKIKRSKTCKIQVNIEGVGMKTFEFNSQGLQWDFK